MRPRIDYQTHAQTVAEVQNFFPGLTAEQMPGGPGFAASETLTLTTHNGTHLDAPWHYHPTQDAGLGNGGRSAMTIDEVPLDWCLRPGVKLDFRHFPDGHVVTADEMAAAFAAIDYDVQLFDIVLINTAAGAALGGPDFLSKICGIGRDATMWLTTRGVRVTGTDA